MHSIYAFNLETSLNINNYNKYTIPQLKEILRKYNCKLSGNKKNLIERILLINKN